MANSQMQCARSRRHFSFSSSYPENWRVKSTGAILLLAATLAWGAAIAAPPAEKDATDPGGPIAQGAAIGSPGVASGTAIQVPIHVPVDVCGNTVNVIASLNPAFGNACVNN